MCVVLDLMNPSAACAEATIWRQSRARTRTEPGRVKHCKYLCRGAQRWRRQWQRHQNANGAAQPKRCQDASGCENVSLLIAQAFQCPLLHSRVPFFAPLFGGFPVRSSVELQMCQLSTFRLPNGISIPHCTAPSSPPGFPSCLFFPLSIAPLPP